MLPIKRGTARRLGLHAPYPRVWIDEIANWNPGDPIAPKFAPSNVWEAVGDPFFPDHIRDMFKAMEREHEATLARFRQLREGRWTNEPVTFQIVKDSPDLR